MTLHCRSQRVTSGHRQNNKLKVTNYNNINYISGCIIDKLVHYFKKNYM